MVHGVYGEFMDHVPKAAEEVLKSVTDNVQPLHLLMGEEAVQEHRLNQKLAMSTCVPVNQCIEVKPRNFLHV